MNPFCFKSEKPTIKFFDDILIASKLLQLFRHPKLCTNQQWMAFMSSQFFRHLLVILLCFFLFNIVDIKTISIIDRKLSSANCVGRWLTLNKAFTLKMVLLQRKILKYLIAAPRIN